MQKLRIVHYLEKVRWTVGGVMRAAMDWCSVFAAREHEVTLITPDPLDVPPQWMSPPPGVPRCMVVPKLGSFDLLNAEGLQQIKEKLSHTDILHLHAPWTTSNVQVARIARSLGVPYVLTVHGMLDDWCMTQRGMKKKLYLTLFGRKLIDQAAVVHCTAMAEMQQARKWFSNERIAVLPYLFDLGEFRDLPGKQLAQDAFEPLRQSRPKVLFLSRIHPKKGLELLIEAVSLLKTRNLPVELVVAGEGEPPYVQSLQALVRQHGLESTVHFVGLVKGAMKLSVFQAADIFALPTSQENFGLVLPESLACGTPIITTKGVDIWQDMQAAGGIIVDRSPQQLADAIQSLITDPARREKLSQRGQKWVAENLDPEKLANSYEALYQNCINAASARPASKA